MEILLIIAAAVYVICSLETVKENEVAIVSYFDSPYKVVGSGFQFVPCLVAKLIRYSTTIQEYEFGNVGVLTAKSDNHSSVKMTGDLSVRFRFPTGNALRKHTLIALPQGRNSIDSLLKEAALDIVEGVAHAYDWEDLYHNTRGFNDKITEIVEDLYIDDPENVIAQAHLKSVKIMFTNPNLPKELEEAIHKPESAELLAIAAKKDMIKRAEGEAEAKVVNSEADAIAKINLADAEAHRTRVEYQAILGDDYEKEDGRAIRQMEAFEQAAQGDSNMIISMPELSEFASQAAGLLKKAVKPSKK